MGIVRFELPSKNVLLMVRLGNALFGSRDERNECALF